MAKKALCQGAWVSRRNLSMAFHCVWQLMHQRALTRQSQGGPISCSTKLKVWSMHSRSWPIWSVWTEDGIKKNMLKAALEATFKQFKHGELSKSHCLTLAGIESRCDCLPSPKRWDQQAKSYNWITGMSWFHRVRSRVKHWRRACNWHLV